MDEFGGKAKILGQFCWLRNQVAGEDDDVESCGGVGQKTYQVRRLDVEGKLLLLEVLKHGDDGQLMAEYLLAKWSVTGTYLERNLHGGLWLTARVLTAAC